MSGPWTEEFPARRPLTDDELVEIVAEAWHRPEWVSRLYDVSVELLGSDRLDRARIVVRALRAVGALRGPVRPPFAAIVPPWQERDTPE